MKDDKQKALAAAIRATCKDLDHLITSARPVNYYKRMHVLDCKRCGLSFSELMESLNEQ